MMEALVNQQLLPPTMVAEIEGMGALAVSVMNRWSTGWPSRVAALAQAGRLIPCLRDQVEQEADLLANEANLRHLARHEILKMYEIREDPPLA